MKSAEKMFLSYSLCSLLFAFFGLGFSNSYYEEDHKHVFCYYNSTNCTVYVNQTVTFVCTCVNVNCVTRWQFNDGDKTPVNGVDYIVNITNQSAGELKCYNDHSPDQYNWTITVLQPKPPKFMETPVNHYFTSERVNIGNSDGNRTCYICVNCTVTGAPPPDVTWEYKRDSMSDFSSIVINQSNASSPYFALGNGQKLCYNDIRNYHLIDNTNYRCTAANVGGSTYGIFTALVSVYPLPQPGPSATKGPVVMTEQSATLTMDTTYQQESPYLQVCSLTTNICCHCQGTDVSNCKFGKLSSSTDNGGDYTSCQLTTSKPDQYQFQVYTYNYPCFYDIGDPIEVDDDNSNSSEFDFRMLSYSLGGVSVLLVLGIIGTFCVTRKVYKGRYVQLDDDFQNADDQVEIPVSFRGPVEEMPSSLTNITTASNYADDGDTPTEQTPLLADNLKPVVSKSPERHGGKTEHVHGRMKPTIGDNSYTTDRGIETPHEGKHSVEEPSTNSSESSQELFAVGKPKSTFHGQGKVQELVGPGDYAVMHIGSSHNIGGVKSFISNQADLLPVCSENPVSDAANSLPNEPPMKDADENMTIVSPNQETQVRKVVYITHYSDSKDWITTTLKPILDKLNVHILTIEDAVVGLTIATAHDELVNKADKIVVIFSLQSKEDKKSLESKWINYDLDRAKHKNPDPSKISFIPILYGDTKQADLPRPFDNVIVLRADSTNLEERIKQSIFQ